MKILKKFRILSLTSMIIFSNLFLGEVRAENISITKGNNSGEQIQEKNDLNFNYQSKSSKVINKETRSKIEIKDKQEKLMHSGITNEFVGDKYIQKPNVVAPYKEGALTQTYLQDALNAVNMVRYIAGYPDDIEMKNELNNISQYGSVILAKLNTLTHNPQKPSDMSEEFYDKAYKSTSSSNIAYGFGYRGNFTIARSIMLYMDDSDDYNIDRLGHRRWILDPDLKYVGFGYAENDKGAEFTTTNVINDGRGVLNERLVYDYMAWPVNGAFPIQYFDNNQAWSVTLDNNTYSTPTIDEVKVKITRIDDNKIWNISKGTSDGYFNVDNGNYGEPKCIIFRPNIKEEIKSGDKFKVEITGIKKLDGTATSISYETEFFDVLNYMNDIEKHWAENQIKDFIKQGYINGYEDNTFKPDNNMTRAEFVKVVNKVFGYTQKGTEQFIDVNKDDWFYDDICIGIKEGYIKGKSTDIFAPTDNITREEVAMILTNIMKNKDENLDKLNTFKDGNKTSQWAQSSVEGAIEAGYLNGDDKGLLNPTNNITRAEAISMLSRVKK